MIFSVEGVAGTGKTTLATKCFLKHIKKSNVCYETFRRNMAQDFIQRVSDLQSYHLKWVTTTHGICFRLLATEFDYTRRNIATMRYWREFCRKNGIPISTTDLRKLSSWSEEGLSDIDEIESVGGRIYTIYSNCVNMLLDVDDWHKLPPNMKPTIDPPWNADIPNIIDKWLSWLEKEDKVDFPQMLRRTYELKLTPPVEVYISDEFQDKTPIQYELFKLWSKNADKTLVCFDKNQCVPKGSKVLTPHGWKNIEDIREGEYVLTAMGKHRVRAYRVVKKHSEVTMKRFIKFRTESGYEVEVTDDHLMFAYIPTERSEDPSTGGITEAIVMPAKNVLTGMYIPVYDQKIGKIRYDRVVERIEEIRVDEVYDLEVEVTHNYIVNGVVVHNCIYAFWGTTPKFCDEVRKNSKFMVLSPSWRLSKDAYTKATKLLRMSNQEVFDVECVGQTTIHEIDFSKVTDIINKYKDILILARTNHHLRVLAGFLNQQGIPFRGRFGWSDRQLAIYSFIWKYRNAKTPIYKTEFLTYLRSTKAYSEATLRFIEKSLTNELTIEDVDNYLPISYKLTLNSNDPIKLLDMSEKGVAKLTNAISRNIPPRSDIFMTTIHGAKGLEADTVIVFDGITSKIQSAITRDVEEFKNEYRVWYVALTRARKRCFVVRRVPIRFSIPFLPNLG